jgi:hypothetical protein
LRGKVRQEPKKLFFLRRYFFDVRHVFFILRWRIAELLFKNPRKVRRFSEADFKANVGYFFAVVADFIE